MMVTACWTHRNIGLVHPAGLFFDAYKIWPTGQIQLQAILISKKYGYFLGYFIQKTYFCIVILNTYLYIKSIWPIQ